MIRLKVIFFISLFSFYPIFNLSSQNVNWSADLPVMPQTFTEAEKAQQRINGQKLLDTLNLLVSKPSINKEIIVKEDCRFSGNGQFYISYLKKAKIIGIKDKTITLWFDSPHIYGIQLYSCNNVTFSNISFDCDPVPFTQGKIIEKTSNSSVVLQPMTGYENLISNPSGIYIIFNSDGTFKRHGPSTCQIVQNTDKTIELTNGTFNNANPGDYVVLPSRTGSMFSLNQCENIVLDSINVYASGGMICVGDKGKGGHTFRHVLAVRRPGTNRLWVSGADGIHMNELEIGPTIEDCEISYTADDLINIHGRFGWVSSKINNSKNNFRVIFTPGAIVVGQRIDFWDNVTQEYKGHANVTKITQVTNSNDIQTAQSNAIPYLGGSVYDIQLDTEVDADYGCIIEHHANLCSGFVIRNCKLHDTFNRVLINGPINGTIEGNTIENVFSGQSFHMETWNYGEGQYIKNLVVQNNHYKNSGGLWFGLVPPGGNTIYGAYRTTPMKNIQLLNNLIELSPGDIYGITAAYVDTLVIEGNTIIRNMSDNDWNKNDINFTDGYGKSNESAIFVTSCKNISIDNNLIQENISNTARKIDYGLLVNNIQIDNNVQFNSVADIITGWLINGKQDDLGWSYGYVNRNDYSINNFQKMLYQSNSIWIPSQNATLPMISRMTTQPSNDLSSVIRWCSNVNGNLKIIGKIKSTSNLGNKVLIIIYIDGNERYRYDMANGDINLSQDLGKVSVGNFVDFVVDSKGNNLGDKISFNFKYMSDNLPFSKVNTVESIPFKLYIHDDYLVVIPNGSNQILSIYSLDGKLQYQKKISAIQYVNLPKGVYIVKLDNEVIKVIV
jgi:hypothetical protein